MRASVTRRIGFGFAVLLTIGGTYLIAAAPDLRLADAAKNRETDVVRMLLRQPGLDVNTPQPDGATALHWAAHWNDVEMATLLIGRGAHVNAANQLGVTPLSLASTNGSAPMVELLLKAGADVTIAQPSGETPLMTAAWTGNPEVVKLLLDHGADVKAAETSKGQTALMWAISERHPEVARLLVDHGADVKARSKTGFTPLLFAARIGDVETGRILLAAGVDVDEAMPPPSRDQVNTGLNRGLTTGAQGQAGATALLVATVRGHVPFATLLLDHGADPNADGAGYTALHWAVGSWEGWRNRQSALTEAGDEYTAMTGLKGEAKLDMVKALLAHGANPNAPLRKPRYDFDYEHGDTLINTSLAGATPFSIAAKAADIPVMRALVAAGADPQTTKERSTALMWLVGLTRDSGNTFMTEDRALEAAKLLVEELGADVNAVNSAGNTPLLAAAHMRYEKVIQYLVDKGAKINVKNKDGQTPLMIAERNLQMAGNAVVERNSAGELLRKLGATE